MTERDRTLFGLGGFIETESGTLGRELPLGSWAVLGSPRIEHAQLVWDRRTPSAIRVVEARRIALDHFVELADADATAVAAFAGRWGGLGICEHGLPASHRPKRKRGDAPQIHYCLPQTAPRGFREPIEAWHSWAALVRAVLRVAARLNADEHADPLDLLTLGGLVRGYRLLWASADTADPREAKRDTKRGLNAFRRVRVEGVDASTLATLRRTPVNRLRQLVAEVVDDLIRLGDVHPSISWKDASPRIELSPAKVHGLFGAVAMQLAATISGSKGLATCSECAKVYTPSRRPKATQANYCSECRRARVPQKRASRRYRATKKKEKRS